MYSDASHQITSLFGGEFISSTNAESSYNDSGVGCNWTQFGVTQSTEFQNRDVLQNESSINFQDNQRNSNHWKWTHQQQEENKILARTERGSIISECDTASSSEEYRSEPYSAELSPFVHASTSIQTPDNCITPREPEKKQNGLRMRINVSPKLARRLKRIAKFQPGALLNLGLAAVKTSDGDLVRLPAASTMETLSESSEEPAQVQIAPEVQIPEYLMPKKPTTVTPETNEIAHTSNGTKKKLEPIRGLLGMPAKEFLQRKSWQLSKTSSVPYKKSQRKGPATRDSEDNSPSKPVNPFQIGGEAVTIVSRIPPDDGRNAQPNLLQNHRFVVKKDMKKPAPKKRKSPTKPKEIPQQKPQPKVKEDGRVVQIVNDKRTPVKAVVIPGPAPNTLQKAQNIQQIPLGQVIKLIGPKPQQSGGRLIPLKVILNSQPVPVPPPQITPQQQSPLLFKALSDNQNMERETLMEQSEREKREAEQEQNRIEEEEDEEFLASFADDLI